MAKRKKKTTRRRKKSSIFENIQQASRTCVFGFLRILPLLMLFSAFTGLFFGVKKVLYADSNLVIQQVKVLPADALSVNRRRELENITLGKNILEIDLEDVARDLESSPQIQSAKVFRHLPGTLEVQVTTREPVAFIRFAPKGSFGVVSRDGMILDVTDQNNASLVTIDAYGLGIHAPRIGAQIRSRGFEETVQFITAYWQHPISKSETLTGLSLDKSGALTITLGQGPDIRLGRRPATRFAVLEKVMHLLEGKDRLQIDYIDLQFDNVIVKRK